jgi:hypothetical protein
MIKIYSNKIEHKPKNKNLFETVITPIKNTKIKKSCSLFPTNPILKDKTEKKLLKIINE